MENVIKETDKPVGRVNPKYEAKQVKTLDTEEEAHTIPCVNSTNKTLSDDTDGNQKEYNFFKSQIDVKKGMFDRTKNETNIKNTIQNKETKPPK